MPDWTSTAGKLVITPVIYANQTAISLTSSALNITWKRKEGSSSEAALTTGESVSGNVLTVSANKLSTITSGLLSYIAYVTYTDPDNGLPINATADISFALVTTGENAKSAWISGEQVFKYAAGSTTSTPAQITLTANLQNVTMGKWQYKNSSGSWTDYPTTSDNASITGTTLVCTATHLRAIRRHPGHLHILHNCTVCENLSHRKDTLSSESCNDYLFFHILILF